MQTDDGVAEWTDLIQTVGSGDRDGHDDLVRLLGSHGAQAGDDGRTRGNAVIDDDNRTSGHRLRRMIAAEQAAATRFPAFALEFPARDRSEEHTSELQSHSDL